MRRLSVLQQRTLILAFLLLCGGFFALHTSAVHAATPTSFSIESVGGQIGLGDTDLKQVVLNIVRWALGFLTLAAVVYMIYGGYVWLTAAGNEQRVEKAKQIILQAAIGLVIVLLAWAIVLFVARTFANTTTNGNTNTSSGGCIDINNCPTGGSQSTFDITAINTCAVPPKTYENVPRSTAVSVTFNTDLKTAITAPTMNPPQSLTADQDPIKLAVGDGTGTGDLQIQKCVDAACTSFITPNPKPIDAQVYTPGATTAGTKAAPLAEWLAINNTLTFYHLSFSDVPAETRVLEAGTTYRVRIPKDATSKGLLDVRDRLVSFCRSNPSAVGNDIDHCQDSADGKYLEYTFTTSTSDINGAALKISNTVPSSEYLTNTALQADRNVSRSAILGINFSAGVDPVSVTTANFRVYKITGVPDDPARGTCGGGECNSVTQIDPAKYAIRVNDAGTGAWLQFADPKEWYEPFTWYKVVVENMRNLCGTAAPKHTWVFETNDTKPGVDFVYPTSGFEFACPTTEVFAQFNTSMWDITKGTSCHRDAANSYNTKALVRNTTANVNVTIRNFDFSDQPPGGATDPNSYCKRLSFDPTTAGLPTDHKYSIGIRSDRVVNQNGDTLQYGDAVPGFTPAAGTPPWNFTVKPAGQCYQAPYISSVSPGEDKNGACLSITGNYFEKINVADVNANQPDTGDTLTFGGVAQTGSEIKSWTNNSIVNKLNAGSLAVDQKHDFQVGVNYPNPVNQILLSNKQPFMLRSGGPTRACLTSLEPSQGFPSSLFTANGENFGATGGTIETDNRTPWDVTGTWSQTKISNIQVRSTANIGATKVWVENAAGVPSNSLPYTVLNQNTNPAAGDIPRVVENGTCDVKAGAIPSPNPYRDDTAACLNSEITVRFNVPLDSTTVAASTIGLFSCPTTGTCDTAVATTITSAGTQVKLKPAAPLSPATKYQVRLTTGIKGLPPGTPPVPGTGLAMAAPYSWYFTTKTGTEDCVLSDVTMNPNGNQTTNNANYTSVLMSATPVDNACHTLTHDGLTFTWVSTNTNVGQLLSVATDDLRLLAPPAGGATTGNPDATKGVTNVTVAAQSHTSAPFTLTYSPTACTTSADCSKNALGQSCGSSTCNNGQCTPVINSLDKNKGPAATATTAGTWTTINGCWFGSYDAAKSKVKFTAGASTADGVLPDPAQCGAETTWTNEWIVREVPVGATSGAVSMVRNDLATATLASGFTVNTDPLEPGLCKVVPLSGHRDDPATLTGRGFGTRGANDSVTFTPLGSSVATPVTLYPTPGWADKAIALRVPSAATIAVNLIRVVKGTQSSNALPYSVTTVSGSTCTNSCQFGTDGDTFCAGKEPGTACSYPGANGLGCCAPKPKIVDFSPAQGATNMCRNATPQIRFDQPLDGRTVTSDSVVYQDGVRVVDGSVSTSESEGQGIITYRPGLTSANNQQTLSLSAMSSDTSATITVANPSFETASNDVPTGWAAITKAKQSTEVPPGHSGFSVLADCSTCATGQQAYAAQDIANTHDSQATYRVTGWVKTEMPTSLNGTGRAGLITRCSGSASCPYDLLTPEKTPGLLTATKGWTYIDMLLKNSASSTADISLDCFANPKTKVWCDDITVTKVTTVPTTIRGANGVIIDPTSSPLQYTNGQNICTLDAVAITPTSRLFTQAGELEVFTAEGMSLSNQTVIAPISNQYEWSWGWSSDKSTVASVAMSSAANASPSTASVTANANGKTLIKATATVTKDTITNSKDRKVEGQSDVTVAFCENPWQLPTSSVVGFSDSQLNCDLTAGGCQNFNFSMNYCRDNATKLLPNFIYTGADTSSAPDTLGSIEGLNATDPTRLKSFFFKESATSRDTIGLLIFKNDDFLSPTDWFAKRFPLDTVASSTVIAGYPAVKSGTTTYIGVTDRSGSTLRGLMFVFDYNSNNASPDTVTIANQLLENIVFNTNVTSSVQRGQLIRDTKRRQDLTSLKNSLAAAKSKTGAYPALASGSYIPGFSTSKWPSWQTTLGTELSKTLPLDPANVFSAACTDPKAEAATCWAESTKTFSCPANSQVYGFRNAAGAVDLYATMEYRGVGSFIPATPPSGICTGFGTCDCFNYSLHVGP